MTTEALLSIPPPNYVNKRPCDEYNEISGPKRILVVLEEEEEEEFKKLDWDDCNPYPPDWIDYSSDDENLPIQLVPSDYEMLEWPDYPDWVYCTKKPHERRNQTILEYLFNEEEFITVLAHKVMKNTQLKHLTDDLMLSLLKPDDHHDHVFACKVNDLVNSPDFIQSCSDTYFGENVVDGCVFFISFIYTYKDGKPPHERMKDLREDPFLQRVLEQTESLPITRGVLSALFGFWSDDALYDKVTSSIVINRRKMN